MISDKALKYGEILTVCWVLVFGVAGILAITTGSNGTNVPILAWYCMGAMLLASIAVHYIRKEKRLREHEDLLNKYPHMRSLYDRTW